jgi:hypothetical protein
MIDPAYCHACQLDNYCVLLSVMALASAELVLNDMLSWPRGVVLEIRSSMGRSEHVYDWVGSSHPLTVVSIVYLIDIIYTRSLYC